MNLRIADLHTHSNRSDGAHTPADVVRMAGAAGVSILGLTDHDTIEGNREAAAESDRIGIDFVPGIEISALHDQREFHILGYLVEPCQVLTDYVEKMEIVRGRRVEEIGERLNRTGLSVDTDGIRELAAGVATRAHVAAYLVLRGKVETVAEAFELYLGPGCPGYVPAAVISVADAIELIHDAGGCASLAHPAEWVGDRDVEAFTDAGLDAIETVHPSHDERLRAYHAALARRLGLLETGGSDFHDVRRGTESRPGAYYVSGDRVDDLRRRASRYRATASSLD